MSVDLRHQLPGPGAAQPAGRLGLAADRRARRCVRLEEAGAGAVVLPSLFEEQIIHDQLELDRPAGDGAEHFAEALHYFPDLDDYNTGPPTATSTTSSQAKAGAVGPGDRQPQRHPPPAAGSATRADRATPAPTPSS